MLLRAPLDLDHCFGGWDGRTALHCPQTDLALVIEAAPLLDHLVICVPHGQNSFCIEPISHVNDGFELREHGVKGTGVCDLAPGKTLGAAVRIRVV